MSDNRLFDPREYGSTIKKPRNTKAVPDTEVVTVRAPWVVLQHFKSSPLAHLIQKNTSVSIEFVSYADCGARGVAMTGLDGTDAPACPNCWALANPEAAL